MTPPTAVIVNPGAGSVDDISALRERFSAPGDLVLQETRAPGDGARFARAARAAGCRRIVAVGGDGTLNEIVTGLAPDWGGVEIGVVPLGTGNDFARSAGIPAALDEALAVLERGRAVRADLLRLDSPNGRRWAVNAAAAGFPVAVDEAIVPGSKDWLGRMAYIVAAGRALPGLQEYALRVVLDDGGAVEVAALSFIAANGATVAGGLTVAPDASIHDGLLDLVVYPVLPLARLTSAVTRLLAGGRLDDPGIVTRRVREATLESTPPMPFNVDGEIAGTTPLTIAAIPGAFRLIVP